MASTSFSSFLPSLGADLELLGSCGGRKNATPQGNPGRPVTTILVFRAERKPRPAIFGEMPNTKMIYRIVGTDLRVSGSFYSGHFLSLRTENP
jgi:hypothetical protein